MCFSELSLGIVARAVCGEAGKGKALGTLILRGGGQNRGFAGSPEGCGHGHLGSPVPILQMTFPQIRLDVSG